MFNHALCLAWMSGVLCASPQVRALTPQYTYRLNDPHPIGSLIRQFAVSPDGERVVYIGEPIPTRRELFSVPVDGSEPPLRIANSTFVGGLRYVEFLDASNVMFFSSWGELFHVPADGSAPPLSIGGWHIDLNTSSPKFRTSPDKNHVAFLDKEVNLSTVPWNLFLAPTDASWPPVQLGLGDPSLSGQFVFSPDGTRIAWVEDGTSFRVAQVGPNPQIHSVPGTGREMRFNATGERIVYRSLSDRQLYSVLADGTGAPVALASVGPDEVLRDQMLTPDGATVVFQVFDDPPGTGPYESPEIFSVPVDGSGAPVRLNGPLAKSDGGVRSYRISPDGSRVVYGLRKEGLLIEELYSVPVGGGQEPTLLVDAIPGGDGARIEDISADGTLVAFLAATDSPDVQEVFVAPVDGAYAPIKVNRPFTSSGFFGGARFVGDNVFYSGNIDGEPRLYASRTDGTGTVDFGPGLGGFPGTGEFEVLPSKARIVYASRHPNEFLSDLFAKTFRQTELAATLAR